MILHIVCDLLFLLKCKAELLPVSFKKEKYRTDVSLLEQFHVNAASIFPWKSGIRTSAARYSAHIIVENGLYL
jgi:hypothetical protein